MEKDRQKELQEALLGIGADGKALAGTYYAGLPMQDLILLHHMSAVYMQNNAKDAKRRLFFAKRMAFFENHVIVKLWALEECFILIKKERELLYTEVNPKTQDNQIFVFSTKEGAKAAVDALGKQGTPLDIKAIPHSQFPPFFLNLFSRGVTAVIIDRGQTVIGLPVWAVCSFLKEDFVQEQSRPAVRLWIKKELYILYSSLTKLPYVECDSETFDDQVFVYATKDAAEAAVKDYGEKHIPLYSERLLNRQFYRTFFELYLLGVNAVKTENDGIIQLTGLVPKPDYSKLPEEKQPILNPELMLTAIYICQEERRPEGEKDSEELKGMKEELFAHLREGRLAMPAFVTKAGDQPDQVHFPVVTLTNGEQYCPVFTDLQTARDFELKEKERVEKDGGNKPEYRYMKMYFDKILAALPAQIKGVIINPNTINLMMRKTDQNPAGSR